MQALLRVRDELLLPVAGDSYAALCASVRACLHTHGIDVAASAPLVLRCSFAQCALQLAHDSTQQQQQQQQCTLAKALHSDEVYEVDDDDTAHAHDDTAAAAVAAALLARAGVSADERSTCVHSQSSFAAVLRQWQQLSSLSATTTSQQQQSPLSLPVLSVVPAYAAPCTHVEDGETEASGLVRSPVSRRTHANTTPGTTRARDDREHWLSRYCRAVQAQHRRQQQQRSAQCAGDVLPQHRMTAYTRDKDKDSGRGSRRCRQADDKVNDKNNNNNNDGGGGEDDVTVVLRVYDVYGTLRGHMCLNLLHNNNNSDSSSDDDNGAAATSSQQPQLLLSLVSVDELLWLVRTSLSLTLCVPLRVCFGIDDDDNDGDGGSAAGKRGQQQQQQQQHAQCDVGAATHCHVIITVDDEAGDDDDDEHKAVGARGDGSHVHVSVCAHKPVRASTLRPLERGDDARALLRALLRYGATRVYLVAVLEQHSSDDADDTNDDVRDVGAAKQQPLLHHPHRQQSPPPPQGEQQRGGLLCTNDDRTQRRLSMSSNSKRRRTSSEQDGDNNNNNGTSSGAAAAAAASSRALVVVRCELDPLAVYITGEVSEAVLQWLADAIVLRACVPRHFGGCDEACENSDDGQQGRCNSDDAVDMVAAAAAESLLMLPPATASQLSPAFATSFDATSGVVTHTLQLPHYVLIDKDGKVLERCIANAMARIDGLVPLMSADNNNNSSNGSRSCSYRYS